MNKKMKSLGSTLSFQQSFEKFKFLLILYGIEM